MPPPIVEEQCLRGALEVGGEFFVERHGGDTFLTLLRVRRVEERVTQALVDRTQFSLAPLLPELEKRAVAAARTCSLNPQQH